MLFEQALSKISQIRSLKIDSETIDFCVNEEGQFHAQNCSLKGPALDVREVSLEVLLNAPGSVLHQECFDSLYEEDAFFDGKNFFSFAEIFRELDLLLRLSPQILKNCSEMLQVIDETETWLPFFSEKAYKQFGIPQELWGLKNLRKQLILEIVFKHPKKALKLINIDGLSDKNYVLFRAPENVKLWVSDSFGAADNTLLLALAYSERAPKSENFLQVNTEVYNLIKDSLGVYRAPQVKISGLLTGEELETLEMLYSPGEGDAGLSKAYTSVMALR